MTDRTINLARLRERAEQAMAQSRAAAAGAREGRVPDVRHLQIFEPFTEGAADRRGQEGTGLGLAISRQFVRLMGGEICAQSMLGQGSCFTLVV